MNLAMLMVYLLPVPSVLVTPQWITSLRVYFVRSAMSVPLRSRRCRQAIGVRCSQGPTRGNRRSARSHAQLHHYIDEEPL